MRIYIIIASVLLLCGCADRQVYDAACDALKDASQRDGCYQEKGIVFGDSAFCERIVGPDFRDRCFFRLAIDNSRPKLCREIVKENDANHCYALTTRNDSFCAHVDLQDRRDKCYYDVGVAGKTESCAMVSDAFFRDNCYARYVYATGDQAPCEKIENERRKKECYYTLAERQGLSEPAACDMIPEEYREGCRNRTIDASAEI